MPRRPRTLADLKGLGRDPFAIFRTDDALAMDGAWLARVIEGAPLMFWDDEEEGSAGEVLDAPYQLVDGVALYDIEGPLVQRGWMCWQGYDTIARDLELALADRRVNSVLLRINSPGGMAMGCFEAARQMRAAIVASGKRVVAFADEMAYSAAYCLACVADEIVLPGPGGVGSVGVISSMQSVAKVLAAAGVDTRVFTSGAEKADGHPHVEITKEMAARTQARVEELASIFAQWVGERRGMKPEAVRALEAGVRHGQAAVEAGLADRVESYPALLAAMRDASKSAPKKSLAAAAAATTTTTTTTRPLMHPILAALHAANEAEGLTAVQQLVDLREQLHALTGTATDSEALGTLHAWKQDAETAAARRVQDEKDRVATAARERKALLAQAVEAMKLTPAEAEADGQPEAWTTKLDNDGLRTFVNRKSGTVVRTPDTKVQQPVKGATTASSLTEDQRALADQLGLAHDEYAKALAAQD